MTSLSASASAVLPGGFGPAADVFGTASGLAEAMLAEGRELVAQPAKSRKHTPHVSNPKRKRGTRQTRTLTFLPSLTLRVTIAAHRLCWRSPMLLADHVEPYP